MTNPFLIYIVDDDPVFHFGMSKMINNLNLEKKATYEVKNFNTPNEAIIHLGNQCRDDSPLPKFIFLDYDMPEMNGIMCKKELDKLTNEPLVYLVTSTIDQKEHEMFTQVLGNEKFFLKPISQTDLKSILN